MRELQITCKEEAQSLLDTELAPLRYQVESVEGAVADIRATLVEHQQESKRLAERVSLVDDDKNKQQEFLTAAWQKDKAELLHLQDKLLEKF